MRELLVFIFKPVLLQLLTVTTKGRTSPRNRTHHLRIHKELTVYITFFLPSAEVQERPAKAAEGRFMPSELFCPRVEL